MPRIAVEHSCILFLSHTNIFHSPSLYPTPVIYLKHHSIKNIHSKYIIASKVNQDKSKLYISLLMHSFMKDYIWLLLRGLIENILLVKFNKSEREIEI